MFYDKPRILLHSCCGPCSTAVCERLGGEYGLTVFFYNPNITDAEEHEKRRDAQLRFVEGHNETALANGAGVIGYAEDAYEPEIFYKAALGLEGEAEGGARCDACFRLRLEKTAERAAAGGYDGFTTTLSVSPHKDFQKIKALGIELSAKHGVEFLPMDFKKRDGFRRSLEMSKEYGLYRQDYCGCVFSKRERGLD